MTQSGSPFKCTCTRNCRHRCENFPNVNTSKWETRCVSQVFTESFCKFITVFENELFIIHHFSHHSAGERESGVLYNEQYRQFIFFCTSCRAPLFYECRFFCILSYNIEYDKFAEFVIIRKEANILFRTSFTLPTVCCRCFTVKKTRELHVQKICDKGQGQKIREILSSHLLQRGPSLILYESKRTLDPFICISDGHDEVL